jgi:FixJ family two-component response regulator
MVRRGCACDKSGGSQVSSGVGGLANKDIATNLHLAIHTVKSHVHNVLEKLALHSRLEVAAFSRNSNNRGDRKPIEK